MLNIAYCLKGSALHSNKPVNNLLCFSGITFNHKKETVNIKTCTVPPCGPMAPRFSASDMRVWAWHSLCIPTPACRRWSSERPGAFRSAEVRLRADEQRDVREHFTAAQVSEPALHSCAAVSE